ncbi:MAG: DNA polymerase III subunit beta [Chloroflexi bacterium]|nr:DNA polymerase III subunit beta [Chloroflexota bacterium]
MDLVVPAEALLRMLDSVLKCAAREKNRPILCGVHMRLQPGMLTLAGADGYRLGVERLPVVYDGDDEHLTLPSDTVKKLLRVLRGHKDCEVGITLPSERNRVTFTLPNTQVSAQLLEERFPDYASIIPRSPISQVVMYASDVKVALQRAKIFAKDNAKSCCLKVVPARNPDEPTEVLIGARSPEQRETQSMLDATASGERFEWSANYKYLLDAVETYRKDAERIVIDTNGPENPAVIRPATGRPMPSISDSGSLTVIMPMAK